jgi:hypothetical protein
MIVKWRDVIETDHSEVKAYFDPSVLEPLGLALARDYDWIYGEGRNTNKSQY